MARKSPVVTQVPLHDNQSKKQVVRNISTQSSPAVQLTPANFQIDLPQSASGASVVSIVAATSSSSTSFPSSSRYPPRQTSSQTAAALMSSEDLSVASSDIPVASVKVYSACNQLVIHLREAVNVL
ncbi:hypothetical protein RMATCC62417_13096 [Rhizopus microsporus]|nr:hypothetical protein RMATCC62417_13096 [Rhizopus microsporus]